MAAIQLMSSTTTAGTVEASKASSLLDFEMDESACGDASELKRRGNALFGEKDWVMQQLITNGPSKC